MTPFVYTAFAHVRRHGPGGYAAYKSYRPWLRDEFAFRCVYCLKREQWGLVRGTYDLDHFHPLAHHPGTVLDYDNLLYACASCNAAKGVAAIPNPCGCMLDGQVVIEEDGSIQALTVDAARLIRVLGLDDAEYKEFWKLWIGIVRLCRREEPDLFRALMKYPDELPNLAIRRPPQNSRPDGIGNSHCARRERGELPETY